MLTVLEAIKLTANYLESKGIESPRVNAELLLSSILKCKRLDLYLKFDRPLSDDEKNKYREYMSRRANREPVQYIIGEVEFYGLQFKVNKNVLIPRQETETLIDSILNKCRDKSNLKILDIGTGSGNIAITLAKNLVEPVITAIDISEDALFLAKENTELNDVSDVIKFKHQDILKDMPVYEHYDLIVSNPPYVELKEYDTIQEEIKTYEPRIAVTDEADGFKYYERICEIGTEHLNPGGHLFLELGHKSKDRVSEIMHKFNYVNIETVNDYLDIPRVIFGEKK